MGFIMDQQKRTAIWNFDAKFEYEDQFYRFREHTEIWITINNIRIEQNKDKLNWTEAIATILT